MQRLAPLFLTLVAIPAFAHEIAAEHSHVGEAVLMHMSPLLAIILGIGIAALASIGFLLARRGKKGGSHDPR